MCACEQGMSVGIYILLTTKIHHIHVVDGSSQRQGISALRRPRLIRNMVQRISRILTVSINFVAVFQQLCIFQSVHFGVVVGRDDWR